MAFCCWICIVCFWPVFIWKENNYTYVEYSSALLLVIFCTYYCQNGTTKSLTKNIINNLITSQAMIFSYITYYYSKIKWYSFQEPWMASTLCLFIYNSQTNIFNPLYILWYSILFYCYWSFCFTSNFCSGIFPFPAGKINR